jgi:hypothetical protein
MRVSRVCGKLMLHPAARSKPGLPRQIPPYVEKRKEQAHRRGALGKAPSMPPPL